jgi:hypothetical protein
LTGTASWASTHAAYHDTGGQGSLLLDAVRPLFALLRGDGARAFFLRHQRFLRHRRRGRHLRLNLRATPEGGGLR